MANRSGSRISLLTFFVAFTLLSFPIALPARAAEKWETLADCKLLENAANDGDSFHVDHDGKEYLFRLYFVDTPETDDEYPDRVAEQAAYFNIKKHQALNIGREAARFTKRELSGRFTVVTRWQDARGQSKLQRFYAFVLKDNQDLAQELVQAGLARVFGTKADRPRGPTIKQMVDKLESLERDAKHNHRGAWASSSKEVDAGMTNVTVAPVVAPVPVATNVAPRATEKSYHISVSGIRHNNSCPFFNAPNMKPCGPLDGRPCPMCGG